MLLIVAALVQSAISHPDFQGEIGERLNKPIYATLESNKSIDDIELCVADAVSKLGVPTIFHDGPKVIQMMINGGGMSSGFPYAVTFIPTDSGTKLQLRAIADKFPDKYVDRVKTCL